MTSAPRSVSGFRSTRIPVSFVSRYPVPRRERYAVRMRITSQVTRPWSLNGGGTSTTLPRSSSNRRSAFSGRFAQVRNSSAVIVGVVTFAMRPRAVGSGSGRGRLPRQGEQVGDLAGEVGQDPVPGQVVGLVEQFRVLVRAVDIHGPVFRVDQPDERNAVTEVLADSLANPVRPVARGKDFDDQIGGTF